MPEKLKAGVDSIFSERRKFIIIGLTGRTGSGCTTVADFLTNSFDEFAPPKPFESNYSDDEQRKYRITYEYASKHWDKFHKIRIRDIITSFILEEPFETFQSFVNSLFQLSTDDSLGNIRDEFTGLHEIRLQVKTSIEKNEDVGLSSEQASKLYFETIGPFTDNILNKLNGLVENGFAKAYQSFANNIRNSGSAYSDEFMPQNINRLSQRTNALIKILRSRSKRTGENVCIVIDSIRNPYEASFFSERYSSFYLWSITTKEHFRKERLRRQYNLNEIQIEDIDKKEYPKKLRGHHKFSSINVQDCIQQADVHIYNEEDTENGFSRTKRKILKYVSLIKHPGLVTPTRNERLMQIAFNAKVNSGCISRQVGAVVTDKDFSVKAIGWNNSAQGQVPCLIRNVGNLIRKDDSEAFSDYERKDTVFNDTVNAIFQGIDDCGHNLTYCFKDIKNYIDGEKNQVHTRALHAEENAFLQLTKYGGTGIAEGYLYTTASPCEICSKKAYQLGIQKILYVDPYPGISESHILNSGRNIPKLRLFEGAIGRAYNQLFNPIMSYKDELEMLLGVKISSPVSDKDKQLLELQRRLEIVEAEKMALQEELSKN